MSDIPDKQSQWRDIAGAFLDRSDRIISVQPMQGGFSGAVVIDVQADSGRYVLRGWPWGSFSPERIFELHRFLLHLASEGLPVALPRLRSGDAMNPGMGGGQKLCQGTSAGQSLLVDGTQYWQLENWLPGKPCSAADLTDESLCSVTNVVSQMHRVARRYVATAVGRAWFAVGEGVCPAVSERRKLIQNWTVARIVEHRDELRRAPCQFRSVADQILDQYFRKCQHVDEELAAVETLIVRLQPCWRDLWSDHVLLSGLKVTGLIDAAATRTDHIATDLSRLLGSLFADDRVAWQRALDAYHAAHPLEADDYRLISALDRSAVLLSGMTWIERWARRSVSADNLSRIVRRLERIAERLHQL